MLCLSNYPDKNPYGFFAGFSAGCLYPLKFSLDQQIRNQYKIEKIEPHPQFHLSLEGTWNARITRSGLYFTLKLASDIPSMLVGSIGRFHMEPESDYSVNDRGIKMYSFRISGGIGYTFRRKFSL